MKHKRKNRFLSLLLAVFMTVPLLFGMTVYAEEDSVNVIDPPAITLNKSTVYIAPGSTCTLTATLASVAVGSTVVWTSSNTSVATVTQNGKITAVTPATLR